MGKPILYGTRLSPPVRACLLTAAEIGLDYEFRDVDFLAKEHLSEEFQKKNPQHTVPTLEVDGQFIWDSHAIIAFLVGKYAKDDTLYPKDLLQRAVVDQRLHFDSGILFPRLRGVVAPFLHVLLRSTKTSSTIPQHLVDGLNEGYNFLETFLGESKFVAGNTMTIADLSLISSISTITGLIPLSTENHPKLLAWVKRMEALPYYSTANGEGSKALIGTVKKIMEELKAQNL